MELALQRFLTSQNLLTCYAFSYVMRTNPLGVVRHLEIKLSP